MKRTILLLLSLLLLAGCGGNAAAGSYQQITQEEAKEMMDNQEVIILDVREQDEYDGGHIPGARLLPVDTIASAAPEALPDLQAEIWVYCQSGRRSAAAGRALLAMGYQQVRDLGGIGGWTGPLVRE